MARPDLDLKVKVTFQTVEDSPELQNLLRQLIRQEFIHIIESVKVEEIQENASNNQGS